MQFFSRVLNVRVEGVFGLTELLHSKFQVFGLGVHMVSKLQDFMVAGLCRFGRVLSATVVAFRF